MITLKYWHDIINHSNKLLHPVSPFYTEYEIVSGIRLNSRDVFNYLYRHYSPSMFSVISKIIPDDHTAKDILQETFVSIWANIDKYDPEKGQLYTWMRKIASNKAIDHTRCGINNMRSRTEKNADPADLLTHNTHQKTDHIGITKMVMGLEAKYQHLVFLSFYNGHTLEEMSSILNLPLGTVKTRMRQALKLLRRDMAYAG